jgi:hypothetical protein
LANQLAVDRQITPETTIEPVFVGKTHWNQAEYMELWLSVIAGFTFTPEFIASGVDNLRAAAKRSYEAAELDIELMISGESAETRAGEYLKMAGALASLITDGMDAKPVDTVIPLIDTEVSLGSWAERVFACQIGAKVMKASLVKPASLHDLGVVNRPLASDVGRLSDLGATVFDTSNNSARLILSEAAV